MRIPIGFKSADFRLNYLAGELGTCDRSPLPIPVPINSDGLANLALLKQATPLASSVFPGFPDRHSITYLNDGWYNNCRSWIPASMPAWAEIDLGEIFVVQKVRFGSEHEKYWRDRAATEFTIRISEVGGSNWTVVYTHHADQGAVTGTQEFWFQPQNARYVRLDFNATRDGDPVRIDELEIYGRRTPAP